MRSTDLITTVRLAGGNAAVFVVVDHAAAEFVGIHAARSGNPFAALKLIHSGIRQRFGTDAAPVATGLSGRHDRGSGYLSEGFQDELRFSGATISWVFVRDPEGNCFAQRLIRPLEENLL